MVAMNFLIEFEHSVFILDGPYMQLPYGAPTGGVYFGPSENSHTPPSRYTRKRTEDIVRRLQERMGHSLDLSDESPKTHLKNCQAASCTCLDSLRNGSKAHKHNRWPLRHDGASDVTTAESGKQDKRDVSRNDLTNSCVRQKRDPRMRRTRRNSNRQLLPVATQLKRKSSSTSDLAALRATARGDEARTEQLIVDSNDKHNGGTSGEGYLQLHTLETPM